MQTDKIFSMLADRNMLYCEEPLKQREKHADKQVIRFSASNRCIQICAQTIQIGKQEGI